jgi:hypothetical protein
VKKKLLPSSPLPSSYSESEELESPEFELDAFAFAPESSDVFDVFDVLDVVADVVRWETAIAPVSATRLSALSEPAIRRARRAGWRRRRRPEGGGGVAVIGGSLGFGTPAASAPAMSTPWEQGKSSARTT